jgi:anti-sigma-K factor RskA
MNERDHEARRDELAAYLLGALAPGEVAGLEQHLAGCEECQTELTWLRPAVQVLPESVERVEPPRELRARIMGEVRTDPAGEGARDGSARRPKSAGRNRATAWIRSFGLRPVVGLAAILAIVAGVAGYAIRDSGSGGAETTVSAGHAPGVTAKMVRRGDTGTLHLANVDELPPGKVLQAWVRRGKRVESAKTLFVPSRDGTATAAIERMDGVNAVMVTVEPRGGSAQPTTKPIVAVAIPQ